MHKSAAKDIVNVIFFVITIVFLGAMFYSVIEGWSLFDSVYFVVVTITTVGYGDFIPTHTLTKILTMIYSLSVIPMVFYFGPKIVDFIVKKRLESLARKIDLDLREEKGELAKDIKKELKRGVKQEVKKELEK